MKKALKKLVFIIPGLLLIASVFAFISTSYLTQEKQVQESTSTTIAETSVINSSNLPGYAGSIEIVYSEDFWIDSSGSNVITSLDGVTEFYMSIYINVTSGFKSLQMQYKVDSSKALVGGMSYFAGNMTGLQPALADGRIPSTEMMAIFGGNADYGSKLITLGDIKLQSDPGSNSWTFTATDSGGASMPAGKYLYGKVKIVLQPGADSFSAEHYRYVIAGADAGTGVTKNADPSLNIGIGAGSLSDSTDISGTIKGALETTARNYTATSTTGTVSLTVPAAPNASNTGTLTVSVDGGKGTITSFTGTGISGSNGTYTVTFSGGRGSTVSGTLNVTAQDTTTTHSYPVSIEWEKYDDKLLTGMSISQDQGSYTPQFTQNNGSNDTTTVNIPVQISSTTSSVTFTPSVDSSKGTTVKVGSTVFSGTGISMPVSNNTTVNVVVTSEKGTSKTYAYKFTTVSSDLTLSNVQIKNGSGDTLNTPTYNSATKEYTVTIPYTTNGHSNSPISVIATPNKSGNTVTYSPSSVTIAGGGSQYIDVTVTDKDTNETQVYRVTIQRETADLTDTCTGITVVDDDGNTYSTTYVAATHTYTIQGTVPYDVKKLYLTVQGVATTATLYYANEGSAWNGTSAKQFATGPSPDNGNGGPFSTTFKIKAKDHATLADATVYTVKGTRDNGDPDNSITIGVRGATTSTNYSEFTPSSPIQNHHYYEIDRNNDQQAKFILTPGSTKSKVEFSTNGTNFTTWTTASGTPSTTNYNVGTIAQGSEGQMYYVRVTSQTGDVVSHIIHLIAKDTRSDDTTLKSLTVSYEDASGATHTLTDINSKVFSPADHGTYTFKVPYDAKNITVNPVPNDSQAKGVFKNTSAGTADTLFQASTIPAGSFKQYDYYVQSEKGTYGTAYVVQIQRETACSDAYLTDLKVNGSTVSGFVTTEGNKTYTVILPHGTASTSFSYTPANKVKAQHTGGTSITGNATGTISGSGSLIFVNGKANTSITVSSEDNSKTYVYTLNVYAAETETGIDNIRVLDYTASGITLVGGVETPSGLVDLKDKNNNVYNQGATPSSDPVEITVPYSCDKAFMYITANGANAKIFGYGTKNLNVGDNYVYVYIQSEYGTISGDTTLNLGESARYTFKFIREAADGENRLDTFKATDDKGNVHSVADSTKLTFNPDSNIIKITGIATDASNLTLDMTRKSAKSKVSVNGTNKTPDASGHITHTISISWDASGEYSFPIIVTPEDPAVQPKTYTVTLYKTVPPKDTNNAIDGITVMITKDDATTEDKSPASMAPANFPHKITVDGHATSASITVAIPSTSAATVKIEYTCPGSSKQVSTLNPTTFTLPVGVTNVTVYATSEAGVDGTKYNIEITKTQLSDDATISKINVGGTDYPNPSPTTATVANLPKGTTSTLITVTPNDPKATINIQGATGTSANPATGVTSGTISGLKPGKNTVTIVSTPENGKTADQKTYVLDVWVDEDPNLDSLDVTTYGFTTAFNGPAVLSYTTEIPYSANTIEVVYTFPAGIDASLLEVKIDNQITTTGKANVNSTSSRTFNVVVSQKGSTTGESVTYSITIDKQAASTDNLLLDVLVAGDPIVSYSPYNNDYVITLPRSTTSVAFTGIKVSDGATPTSTTTLNKDATSGLYSFNTSVVPGVNKKYIDVKAESGSAPNRYNFYIVVADTDCEITNIELLDAQMNPLKDVDGNTFIFNINTLNPAEFVVPNTTNTVNIRVTMSTMYQTLYINGQDYTHKTMLTETVLNTLSLAGATNPNIFDIYSISEWLKAMNDDTTILPRPTQTEIEDHTSDSYQIKIVRQNLDNDATLKELHASVGSDSTDRIINFDPLTENYIIENVGSASTITINGIPTKTTSKVISGNGTLQLGTILGAGYTKDIDVICQAEDGTTKTYTITISRGPIDPATDNTLASLILTDSNSKNDYIDFNPAKDTYNVTLPVGVTYFTLDARGLVGSPSTIYIDGVDYSSSSLSHTIVPDDWGKTLTYKVYAVSQAGVKGQEYTVNVTITQPSNDNSLMRLEVNDNKFIPNATNDKGPFYLKVPNEIDKVTLLVETNDLNAKIIVNNNNDGIAHIYTGHQLLSEGSNCITVWVVAEDGVTKEYYQVFVERAPRAPQLLTLGVNGEILLDMAQTKTEFDPETKEYRVNVPYYHETADIFATSSEPSDTITGTGITTLLVGDNRKVVTVTNASGLSTEYVLNIRRYSATSTNADAALAWIEEIPQFKLDFDPLKTSGYEYTVPNKIDELHVHFEPQVNQPVDGLPAATVEYYGDKNVHVGLNNVVVVITAPDGVTTKVYVVNVTKEPMNYVVANDNYPDYTVEAGDEENVYKVNIGATKSVDVDFKQFIINKSKDSELEIVVVSDVASNPSEIIISVSDGEVTDIVKLQVESTKNPTMTDFSWASLWPLYIILAIIIILLILILISVNKDKFGKVAKKANNKNEKNDDKEAEKQQK